MYQGLLFLSRTDGTFSSFPRPISVQVITDLCFVDRTAADVLRPQLKTMDAKCHCPQQRTSFLELELSSLLTIGPDRTTNFERFCARRVQRSFVLRRYYDTRSPPSHGVDATARHKARLLAFCSTGRHSLGTHHKCLVRYVASEMMS